jgi:hypothetical protein
VDAGSGKPYPDCLSAEHAVARFCESTGLPAPVSVRSGLGLHVYWPLQHVLDPEIWERYARGLKAQCVEHGLRADPTRTADITSVLRTPGTHHRKAGVRVVECLELVKPYPLQQFEFLSLANRDCRPKVFAGLQTGCQPPPYLADRIGQEFTEKLAGNLSSFEASSGAMIADRCEQVRALRDSCGNLPEPLWYSALGVLAVAEDGDRLGHEWSSGDPRYTQHETQERLDRARQFGPTTCAKFHEINAQVCERCRWWGKIRSPIVLGREDDANRIEEKSGSFEIIRATVPVGQELNSSNAETTSAPVPFPLRWHGEEDPNNKRKWLVKHLLPQVGVGLIAGQWGTAKTFVALDLSAALMMGSQFAGRAVRRTGGVLFVAAEGASEIPIRLCGLVESKFPSHKGKLPFAWAEQSPRLLDKNAINQLEIVAKAAADRMRAEFGVPLVLIIIDTMSAAAGFEDENSAAQGQAAMNVINALSKSTGALVLACDHFGKVMETGTRGTSAKEAAADVVIACLGEKNQSGTVTNLRIAVRKLRGGATGSETAFTLRKVDMGVDEDHDPITTCMIEWSPVTVAAAPEATKGRGWPKSTALFRACLLTTLELLGSARKPLPDGPTVRAVDLERVREEFDKRYPLDSTDRSKQLSKRRQVFKRSRTEAESRGFIGGREIDGNFMLWLINQEDLPPLASGGVTPA